MNSMDHKKISLRNVTKSFKTPTEEKTVLQNITLDIEDGEFVALLGPSGCGKSTILNLISGLDREYSGRIYIEGDLAVGGKTNEHPDINMTYLFQEPRLLPWLTVEKNLQFALQCAKIPRDTWKQEIARFLNMVHLDGVQKNYVHELSGGMQHRVAIARAFIIKPNIILMDEPFSALDELTARSLRQTLLDLWKQDKKTILFVTHNAMEATFLADRICMFSANPGVIREIKKIELERPRFYESEELYTTNKDVITRFLDIIGGVEGNGAN